MRCLNRNSFHGLRYKLSATQRITFVRKAATRPRQFTPLSTGRTETQDKYRFKVHDLYVHSIYWSAHASRTRNAADWYWYCKGFYSSFFHSAPKLHPTTKITFSHCKSLLFNRVFLDPISADSLLVVRLIRLSYHIVIRPCSNLSAVSHK